MTATRKVQTLDLTREGQVKRLDLLRFWDRALDLSGEQKKALAVDLDVDPAYLRRMRTGEKPTNLVHLEKAPPTARLAFLAMWSEAEGMAATVGTALRQMADVIESQGSLALLGTVPRPPPLEAQRSPDMNRAPSAGTGRGSERRRVR